ncbi:MAG: dTMP kinase [Caldisericia bacterium]|nr:dTMP kinase [Caldisericia bacterium]MDD4614222.1 dTMP kinase [Caldisericia bacterium]
MNSGLFIVFEGIDGCGKSTQIGFLENWLHRHQLSFQITKEPTDSSIGKMIQSSLTKNENEFSPLVQLLLFTADRLHHVEQMKNWMLSGTHVICDRFLDSTFAYQASTEMLRDVFEYHEKGIAQILLPDITFFLDVPVDVSLKRVYSRGRVECFENESFLTDVRKRYFERIHTHPEKYYIINGNAPANVVFSDILRYISMYIGGDRK